MLEPWLAEMDLAVDHPREDVEPLGIDDLRSTGRRNISDGRDTPSDDPDIPHCFAVVIDDGSPLDDKVEEFCHARPPGRLLRRRTRPP